MSPAKTKKTAEKAADTGAMKSVLITGGCGFIGCNLVKTIEAQSPGTQITVIDDFRLSSFQNLIKTRADVMAYNVADKAWMEALSDRRFDTVIHLASITDTTVMDEMAMMYDNVEGFRNILSFCLQKKARLVYASSAAVYGSQNRVMKESDAGIPNNIYGFSKWAMENLARFYEDRLQIVGLRFFNVFGPFEDFKGMPSSMIFHLYYQMAAGKRPRIFYDGEQRRDFVYVKDVVSAILCATCYRGPSTVCNVGSGQSNSFNQLIDYLNEALKTSHRPEYFDNPYPFYQNFTQADLTHAQKTIGYQPRYTTREGVLDYVQTYLKDRKVPATKRH